MASDRRYGTVVAGLALVAGVAAVAVGGRGPGATEPTPLDVIPEAVVEGIYGAAEAAAAPVMGAASRSSAGTEAVEAAPAASPVVASEPGVVRFSEFAGVNRTDWDLPVRYNARVGYWIDFLKGRNYDRTRTWLEREGRYGGMIRERLRARGMPEDLLYLAIIESGLSPRAYSRAHAAGMWQFISETGRRYGLEVTSYVDARRDPLQATDAALDYLSELHERFGSWYLAAAGYNSGENRVERILRQRAGNERGNEGVFWLIDDYLPRETRDYVPLMLAMGHIAKDPAKYGFHGVQYQEPLSFEEVEVPGGVSLAAVARAADLETDAVEDLNPHLIRGITPPGKPWTVRVPVGTKPGVVANLDRAVEKERLATVEHRVRRGETLSHIARRYGVSVDALRAANGGVDSRRLQVGQRLRVPSRGSSSITLASAGTPVNYRVRRGDTLWEIARRHGVTVNQIKRWNGIGSRIYPGQRLRIEG